MTDPTGVSGHPSPTRTRHGRTAYYLTWVIFTATVAQLLVGALVPNLDQFAGKAFAARLVAYPVMMLALPAVYWFIRHRRRGAEPLPWLAFALIMTPFLIDVTGNTLNLYDSIAWWDDANHFVNWALLTGGIGVLLAQTQIRPNWALGWLIVGLGALLAIGWEIGEFGAFIRHGTELEGAYQDTLGDEVLGTLGAGLAALVVVKNRARIRASGDSG